MIDRYNEMGVKLYLSILKKLIKIIDYIIYT